MSSVYFIINNLGVGGAQKMIRYVHSVIQDSVESCKLIGLYSRSYVRPSEEIIQICPPRSSVLKVLMKLRLRFRQERPDIVFAFGSDAVVITYFAAFGLGIKVVGSERNDPGHLSFIWKTLTRFVYPRCSGFVFQLKPAMLFYKMNESSLVRVIPNAYFGKQYDSFIEAKNRVKEIACVSARVDRQKGLDVLLKAFSLVHKKYPSYKLVIFGKLDKWSELKTMATNLSIDHCVDFRGATGCLSESIHALRCFVLPSRFEGIPNALIEAMASGVPTVSCDCPPGGPRMLTEDGQAGLLCDVEDSFGMADAICRLIEDDSLCDSLSKKAQNVQIRFDSSLISKQWSNLYQAVNSL